MNIDDLTDAEAARMLGAVQRRSRKRLRARNYHYKHSERINKRRRARYLEDKLRLGELEDEPSVGSEPGQDEI